VRPLSETELYLLFSHGPLFHRALFPRMPLSGDVPDAGLEDLNMTHVRTLVFLRIHGASPLSAVARWLNLEKGSFTPVARRLVAAGLAETVPDGVDRRRTLLALTEAGLAFDDRLRTRMAEGFARQVDRLSAADRKRFFDALARIRELLLQIQPEGACCPHGHPHAPPGAPPVAPPGESPGAPHDPTRTKEGSSPCCG